MAARRNAPQGRSTGRDSGEVQAHSNTNHRPVVKRNALTPTEALEIVQAMTPAELRIHFEDMLRWQAEHGKRLVNLAWYLLRWKYEREPRVDPSVAHKLKLLTQHIGE